MSMYTTEVRFICESLAGHFQQEGFNSMTETIQTAAPQIFDPNIPFFDEDYRLPLETKILRHYYLREICCETVGMWKHYLNSRMMDIMPYYNQLYVSQLLKFNPFWNTDLMTKHNKDINGETSSESNSTETSGSKTTYEETKNTGNTDDSTKTTGTTDKETSTETTANDLETTTTKGATNESEKSSLNKHIDDNSKSETTNYGKVDTSVKTGNHEVTKGGSVYQIENGEVQEHNTTENGLSKDTTDAYSDTPQGKLTNVSENAYLTNYRAVGETDEGKAEEYKYKTFKDHETETKYDDATEKTAYNNEKNESTLSGSDTTGTKIDNTITDDYGEKVTGSNNETDITKEGGTVTTNGEVNSEGSKSEIYHDENSGTVLDKYNKNVDGSVIGNILGTGTSSTTEEYTEHIIGKRGGVGYSSMLLEFRKTFLNIDKMIIDELMDLFFGLW